MKRVLSFVGFTLAGAGALLLALTLHPWFIGWALVAVAGAAVRPRGIRAVAVVALAGAVGTLAGAWSFRQAALPPTRVDRPAGQYTGTSHDLLGAVRARVVIRTGGHVIFAEAHAPQVFGGSVLGIDLDTLRREALRTLIAQAVPDAPHPDSEPRSGWLALSALADALSESSPREDPTLPEGATQMRGGRDSYWGMFPNEFDHACDVNGLPDGTYEGTSSNPSFPATVALKVTSGKLTKVSIRKYFHSLLGDPAAAEIRKRMVDQNRIDVDVVSGATRTSWILRSAAFHACRGAAGSTTRSP